MPNRILRDGITSSETIDALTAEEEVFFYRLLTVCDDYGLMDARPSILKARCFPLKNYTEKQITKWLSGLAAVNLVRAYTENGKPYLSVCQWDQHQRVRNARAKYPQPPLQVAATRGEPPQVAAGTETIENQVAASRGEMRPPRAPAESESESESNPNPDMSGKPDVHPPGKAANPKTDAKAILDFLNSKAHRAYQPVDANLDLIAARLKEGATPTQCRQVIAKKVREWSGDEKMDEYLRPATLFNAVKFAQYVGELVP